MVEAVRIVRVLTGLTILAVGSYFPGEASAQWQLAWAGRGSRLKKGQKKTIHYQIETSLARFVFSHYSVGLALPCGDLDNNSSLS